VKIELTKIIENKSMWAQQIDWLTDCSLQHIKKESSICPNTQVGKQAQVAKDSQQKT